MPAWYTDGRGVVEPLLNTVPLRDDSPTARAGPDVGVHTHTLRERYEAYRLTQGRELLDLLPSEGLRSILRHLREAGAGEGGASGFDGDLTLEDLARRCAGLLPLPPFHVWAEDFHRSRRAYESLPGPPLAPRAVDGRPVTVAVSTFRYRSDVWVADLALRPLAPLWVGHLRFHLAGDPHFVQTGEILREESPEAVRRRFEDFDERTLGALLRSVLP